MGMKGKRVEPNLEMWVHGIRAMGGENWSYALEANKKEETVKPLEVMFTIKSRADLDIVHFLKISDCFLHFFILMKDVGPLENVLM